MRMGKISRRPAIMHRDMTALDSPEKAEKKPVAKRRRSSGESGSKRPRGKRKEDQE